MSHKTQEKNMRKLAELLGREMSYPNLLFLLAALREEGAYGRAA